MYTKKIRFFSLCLLVALMLTSVAGAAPMTSNTQTAQQGQAAVDSTPNEVQPGISPTTGLQVAENTPYRPMLVQISNSAEARPHWYMSEADVVYEMIYWGPAHTRYTAVFNDNHPDQVGSIRSARLANCELRQEWDAPLVFFGGQSMEGTSIYDFFNQHNVPKSFLIDGTRGGKGFSRVPERKNPHDAVANLAEMLGNWPTNDNGTPYEPRSHAFRFSSQPTQGSDTAVEVHVPYDQREYYPAYTYNADQRVYERWYNGEPQYDGKTEKRIVASNVIVQFCTLTFYNSSRQRPVITTTGTGVMDAFIDGKHTRGTWVRNTMNDRTVFLDESGQELVLLPGKTFIQMIPTSSSFTYVRDDRTEVAMNIGAEVPPPTYDITETDEDIDNMEIDPEFEG